MQKRKTVAQKPTTADRRNNYIGDTQKRNRDTKKQLTASLFNLVVIPKTKSDATKSIV